jgi:ABC-type branched-subunit amino acid transport system ATPase component
MLEIDGLDHSYGRHRALRDVAIRVRSGEAMAILGANGAGKSTLLNSMAWSRRPPARSGSTASNFSACPRTASSRREWRR